MTSRRTVAMVRLIMMSSSLVGAAPAWAAQADKLTLADSEVIVQINVRQMLQASVVKKHALDPLKTLLKHNEEIQQLLMAAGVNPLTDIETISVSAARSTRGEGIKLLAVARGRFDPSKADKAAADYAKKHPGRLRSLKEGALTMWEITSELRGESLYAAFADENTVVMTSSKEDTSAAVGRAGKEAPRLSKEMQDALDRVKGEESLWLAIPATKKMKELLGTYFITQDIAAPLRAITGTLELTADARLALVFHTDSPKAASQLKDKLKEAMAPLSFLGAGNDKSSRIAKDVLDNLKVAADKNDVSIRLKITDAQIENAHKKDR